MSKWESTKCSALITTLFVSIQVQSAHATNNPSGIRVPGMDCGVVLSPSSDQPGQQLVPIQTDNALQAAIYNEPILITKAKYAGMIKSAREAEQEKRAMAVAARIAQELIQIMERAEDEVVPDTQLIINQLGLLPPDALKGFQDILTANLASLNDPSKAPEHQRETDNKLAELTRIVTNYRTTVTADVNWTAKFLDKVGLRRLGSVVRTKFQSVQEAARNIDQVFEDALVEMYKEHNQMKRARADLKLLERFAILSEKIGSEVNRHIKEYMNDQAFSEEKTAVWEKNLLEPLVSRVANIVRNRASVATGYEQFALLMDGNRILISVIGNIRETAQLEITIFGAGKIIANDQRRRLDLADGTRAALEDMRVQTVEQLKRQGVMFREIPGKTITSMKALVNSVSQLQNEIVVARNYRKTAIENYETAVKELTRNLDQLLANVEAGLEPTPGSLIDHAERVVRTTTGKDFSDVDALPKIPDAL